MLLCWFLLCLLLSWLCFSSLSRRFSVECERGNDGGMESSSDELGPMFDLVPLDEDETMMHGAGPLRDEGKCCKN